MSLSQFLIVWLLCLAGMLICRCVPIFILKGKELPKRLQDALNLIPPAAFAALVANDIFDPGLLNSFSWEYCIPFVAALVVIVVARVSHSLIWCALAGVVSYAFLTLI